MSRTPPGALLIISLDSSAAGGVVRAASTSFAFHEKNARMAVIDDTGHDKGIYVMTFHEDRQVKGTAAKTLAVIALERKTFSDLTSPDEGFGIRGFGFGVEV